MRKPPRPTRFPVTETVSPYRRERERHRAALAALSPPPSPSLRWTPPAPAQPPPPLDPLRPVEGARQRPPRVNRTRGNTPLQRKLNQCKGRKSTREPWRQRYAEFFTYALSRGFVLLWTADEWTRSVTTCKTRVPLRCPCGGEAWGGINNVTQGEAPHCPTCCNVPWAARWGEARRRLAERGVELVTTRREWVSANVTHHFKPTLRCREHGTITASTTVHDLYNHMYGMPCPFCIRRLQRWTGRRKRFARYCAARGWTLRTTPREWTRMCKTNRYMPTIACNTCDHVSTTRSCANIWYRGRGIGCRC